MKIYIDNDYKCHVLPAEGLRELDVPFFEGKCAEFIEGYRYVPPGETWAREDGEKFRGEMLSPWQDYKGLYTAQLEHELAQSLSEMEDMRSALEMLGVNEDEQVV